MSSFHYGPDQGSDASIQVIDSIANDFVKDMANMLGLPQSHLSQGLMSAAGSFYNKSARKSGTSFSSPADISRHRSDYAVRDNVKQPSF